MSKSTSRRGCAGLRRLIVTRFLPGGIRFGRSGYLARRRQKRVGGERPRFINCDLATGRWYDFVVERRGADLLSLIAHSQGLCEHDAATLVRALLDIERQKSEGGREDRR